MKNANKRSNSNGTNNSAKSSQRGKNNKYRNMRGPIKDDKPDEVLGKENYGRKGYKNGTNEVSWYADSPQLLRDAASIPYSYPIGMPLDVRGNGYSTMKSIPGVLAVHTNIVPGISKDKSSAINVAAANLYAYIRQANSGGKNYDATDLMMYCLAIDNIYCMVAHAVRAYGVASTFSQQNRYYPDAILRAMGFAPINVTANLAAIRARINFLIRKVGSFCVPSTMSYFARHFWMYSGIYTDNTTFSPKCQTYLYVPNGFYKFDVASYDTGTALVYESIWDDTRGETNSITLDSFLTKIETYIAAISNSEDANIMSGDILKAFGDSGVIKMPLVSEDFNLIPESDSNVLLQIRNATFTGNQSFSEVTLDSGEGNTVTVKRCDIVQTPTHGIYYYPGFNQHTPCANSDVILNMPMLNPEPGDTMEGTRLTTVASSIRASGDLWFVEYTHLPSDFATHYVVYSYSYNDSLGRGYQVITFNGYPYVTSYEALDNDTISGVINNIGLLSKFDWHPSLTLCSRGDSATEWVRHVPICDTQTIAVVDEATIGRMHNTALLSMLAVPQMGTFKK